VDRPSSCLPKPVSSSTRSTSRSSQARSLRRLRYRVRTRRRVLPRPRTTSGRRPCGSRRFSRGRRQVGEPDLDERPDRLLEPGLPCHLECLLPTLARLLGIDALLQPVVARDEQLLDLLASTVPLHKSSVTSHIACGRSFYEGYANVARIRVLIADDHRLFVEGL